MIGGPSPSPAPRPQMKKPPAPGPDADDMGQGATVSPEAVMYHDELHTCGTCEYMGEGGNCAILKMPVQEQGACNAFESKNEDESMMAPDEGEGEGEGMPPAGLGQ